MISKVGYNSSSSKIPNKKGRKTTKGKGQRSFRTNVLEGLIKVLLLLHFQTLNLMRNRLTTIPPAVFHLESLTWLFMSGCAIETVPDDWAAPIPMQMNQLDLSENFIQVSKPAAPNQRRD